MTNARSFPKVLRLLPALACLGLAGCAGILAGFGVGMPEALRQNGVSAAALILEIWDTGWTVNHMPVIGMKVRVQPADRPAFEAVIKKTAINRLSVAQFQPGSVVPVRFDPKDPTVLAVDFEGETSSTASSGNPYRDRYVRAPTVGPVFLPPPEVPQLYLGTADSASDVMALLENGYSLLGASSVVGGSDSQQALDQGKEIGAALVVAYGHFHPPPGGALDVLPLRRRPPDPDHEATNVNAGLEAMTLGSGLGANQQVASYWGKTRPAILGIISRPLDGLEQARLGRKEGIVVSAVTNGSPAAAARILAGDVIVAIEGKPIADPLAAPALIASFAGQRVQIDLIRDGRPLSVTVQLNHVSP